MLPKEPEPGSLIQHERPILTPSMIPKSTNFDAKDSQFFKKFASLPSPEEVRKQSKSQYLETYPDDREAFSMTWYRMRPPPVIFKDLGLFVKWGSEMRISEGQSLYDIGRCLKDRVPVPEIYGWRTEGHQVFIYMEYLPGQTLDQVWDILEPDDRGSICSELRTIIDNLRQLEQEPDDRFIGIVPLAIFTFAPFYLLLTFFFFFCVCVYIGNVVKAALYDRAFHVNSMSEAGPFGTVQRFHNWFTFLYRKPMPDPYSVPIEPFRDDLPNDSPVNFTHGDLHRSNILITGSKPYHVLALIDREQSGWLPAYWEARKVQYTVDRNEEWSKKYLPMVLCQFTSNWEPWDYYTISMGC
ncbi:Aminoglycoside phosphotransferase [Penicillium griseofulvum]|uniref:Aminoglycoside phosphotransferase n=1 Tax=Penicillium patulum TaxID=5078 RepID=A0A135LNN8_PENPA|nr:Aminoglycoside phosphotransferase [Penicillium griseofulvum]KXG50572.1 Aminoglycoside phosphotransferase [Penicillium griseofulvum]